MSKLIVLAIGGNSLIQSKEKQSVQDQFETCSKTCESIVPLVRNHNKLLITHGNGPQVGFILRRSELAQKELHTVPLDSCVADTQGAIGYQLQMSFKNELAKVNINKEITTIVTQVVVDRNDPSFQKPSKPIGSFMNKAEASRREKEDKWDIVEDSGRGYRRVVPSPKPKEIIEIDIIEKLLNDEIVVVAAGGGGIPIIKTKKGYIGVEAVIDKDLSSALLATQLNADMFVISTAVERVCINFGTPDETPLDHITVDEAIRYIHEGHFAVGSMLPKIEAIIQFVQATGGKGIITDPENLSLAVKGRAGTTITAS